MKRVGGSSQLMMSDVLSSVYSCILLKSKGERERESFALIFFPYSSLKNVWVVRKEWKKGNQRHPLFGFFFFCSNCKFSLDFSLSLLISSHHLTSLSLFSSGSFRKGNFLDSFYFTSSSHHHHHLSPSTSSSFLRLIIFKLFSLSLFIFLSLPSFHFTAFVVRKTQQKIFQTLNQVFFLSLQSFHSSLLSSDSSLHFLSREELWRKERPRIIFSPILILNILKMIKKEETIIKRKTHWW